MSETGREMDIRWGTLPYIHQLTNPLLPVIDGEICLVKPSAAITDLLIIVSTPNILLKFHI